MNYVTLLRTYTRFLSYAVSHSFFSSLGQTILIALFIPAIRESFSISEAVFS